MHNPFKRFHPDIITNSQSFIKPMRINPPEAATVATLYRLWNCTHQTCAWEALGFILSCRCRELGSWGKAQSWLAEYLPDLPVKTLELALADHNLHVARESLTSN